MILSCEEAIFEPGQKCQKNGAVLADRNVPEVPEIFFDGEAISLSEAKLQVHQVSATRYPADIEKSPHPALRNRRVSTCFPVNWGVSLIGMWPI